MRETLIKHFQAHQNINITRELRLFFKVLYDDGFSASEDDISVRDLRDVPMKDVNIALLKQDSKKKDEVKRAVVVALERIRRKYPTTLLLCPYPRH